MAGTRGKPAGARKRRPAENARSPGSTPKAKKNGPRAKPRAAPAKPRTAGSSAKPRTAASPARKPRRPQATTASEPIATRQLLAQRAAELALIGAIQQGITEKLAFQSIIDMVGDKLRTLFRTDDLSISWLDEQANLVRTLYSYERGRPLTVPPQTPRSGGMYEAFRRTRAAVVLRSNAEYARWGDTASVPSTELSKSMILVPMFSGERLLGNINIENYERENAFSPSDVQLLTTVAASLAGALENARLFDETKRDIQHGRFSHISQAPAMQANAGSA